MEERSDGDAKALGALVRRHEGPILPSLEDEISGYLSGGGDVSAET
jgi:hypothetical protein